MDMQEAAMTEPDEIDRQRLRRGDMKGLASEGQHRPSQHGQVQPGRDH